ncbi:gamma-secretase subunit Aph-1-like [Amblyomma americanum]
MTLLEFTGCSLLGFGPAFSMFVLTVAGEPSRVIVFVTAAFFWLLSLLTASLVWLALVPLRQYTAPGVAMVVLSQEVFRLFFFRVLRKAERVLNAVALAGADEAARMRSRLAFAYTSGLAFGTMGGLFSLLGPLSDALGPGTPGLMSGAPPRLLAASALTAAAFSVLHVCWALVSFNGLDTRRWTSLAFAPVAHAAASAATLLAPRADYAVSLGSMGGLLLVSAALAFQAAGGSAGNIWAALSKRDTKE